MPGQREWCENRLTKIEESLKSNFLSQDQPLIGAEVEVLSNFNFFKTKCQNVLLDENATEKEITRVAELIEAVSNANEELVALHNKVKAKATQPEDAIEELTKISEKFLRHPVVYSPAKETIELCKIAAVEFLGMLVGLVLCPLVPFVGAYKQYKIGIRISKDIEESSLEAFGRGMKMAIGGFVFGAVFAPILGPMTGERMADDLQEKRIDNFERDHAAKEVVSSLKENIQKIIPEDEQDETPTKSM